MSNMYSTKSVKLTLRTSDAVNKGTGNMSGTWRNVDFPNILGHMMEEYAEFNLCLQSIVQYNTGAVGSTVNDVLVQLALTGPPFNNQAYDFTTKSNYERGMFPVFELLPTAFQSTTFDNGVCTFTSCRARDMTFSIIRVIDGLQASSTTELNATFIFNIYGVETSRIHKPGISFNTL
jgi:hypothetical protein